MEQTGTAITTEPRETEPTVRTIARAFDLLDCFAGASALSLAELSARSGLSKSTAHRLLGALERRGAVVRDAASQRYIVGPSIIRLATVAAGPARLRALALPLMYRLRELSEETICLAARVGDRRVFVEQVESPHQLRRTVELGRLFPLTHGASGKVMLAHAEPADQERVLQAMSGVQLTPNTPTDPDLLRDELARVRARGYAVSHGEEVPGVTSVSAPVLDAQGRAIAALSISGPDLRLGQAVLPRLAEAVVEAARELTALVRAEAR